MLQYSIHDRVEVVANHGGVDEGETGVVTAVNPGAAGDRITVLLDGSNLSVLMYPNELKLLASINMAEIEDLTAAALIDAGVDLMAITRSFCR